jgi:hypothetical protein
MEQRMRLIIDAMVAEHWEEMYTISAGEGSVLNYMAGKPWS